MFAELKQEFFRHLVVNSYTDKVTKAFPKIPIGYDAAAKKLASGDFTPFPPDNRRVKFPNYRI
jgi:hypothetical protein